MVNIPKYIDPIPVDPQDSPETVGAKIVMKYRQLLTVAHAQLKKVRENEGNLIAEILSYEGLLERFGEKVDETVIVDLTARKAGKKP